MFFYNKQTEQDGTTIQAYTYTDLALTAWRALAATFTRDACVVHVGLRNWRLVEVAAAKKS